MKISEINIYPIKSLKGITLDSSVVEARGLRFDRRWMLTDRDGKFFTQREFPRMALISVWIEDGGIGASASRFGEVFIPGDPEVQDRRMVTIWDSVCEGVVHAAVLNEWFSDVLETDCQLVYMPDDTRRRVSERFDRGGDIVSFADGYPLLAIGEASLADVNSRLAEAVPMNRFRPNIVIEGSAAYAEDEWRKISVGDAEFISTKPCARCVLTTVDQTTGMVTGKDPLKTLATYRMAKDVMPERIEPLGLSDTAVLFGQNLVPDTIGKTVRVGDEVSVLTSWND